MAVERFGLGTHGNGGASRHVIEQVVIAGIVASRGRDADPDAGQIGRAVGTPRRRRLQIRLTVRRARGFRIGVIQPLGVNRTRSDHDHHTQAGESLTHGY